MDALIPRYCLSLLLLTSIARSAGSNETNDEVLREPRVTGRIVKLYSGAKPEPYLCTGEGFQADPSNCAAFYRCVKERSGKFTVFRYQCAPGTVYDPDVETCNHPRSTRRTECGGKLKPTAEPYLTTNNNEIDGAQSEIPRPISTRVPIYAEQTTPKNPTTLSWILSTERQNPTKTPWTSTMYSIPSSPGSSNIKLPDSTTSNQWLYSTQHQWESQYPSKPPSKATQSLNSKTTEPCTSDGFMGDSENCRKFYRCVGNQRGGYVKYEFSCSELTVWDDEIQGCNHPWAVKRSKCGRSLYHDDKSTSHKKNLSLTIESATKNTSLKNEEFGNKYNKTIQHQLQISHGSKATQTQTQISNSPNVIQNQTQINYGDRRQNNTYSKSKQNQTQISYGTAVSQTQTQIDYGNKGMQTQLQIDHSKDSSQSQVQIVDATTLTTSTPANNNGKHECSDSGFMGDVNDCKKFYRCVNNGRGYTKYEFSCGDGTVWDPEIEACNHAWAVKECGGKHSGVSTTGTYTTTTAKLTEHTKTTPSYTTSQVPDIDDENDVGYGNQNNQEVTSFSTTTMKTTTTTAKSTTRKPSGAATECTTSGFMGDANDCKVFYRCVDNGNSGFIKHEFKCGDGTVWDSDIEACNHAWAVKKCGGSTTIEADKEETTTKKENTTPAENLHTTITLIQITTQAPTQSDDYDTGYGSQHHEFSSTITPTTKPVTSPQDQGTNNNTICKSSGFVGDEKNCKKFYRCVDNGNGGYIKYEFTCGQGTVWDPKIDACNHAWAVEECGGSNHINEGSSYETTSQLSSTTSSGDSASIHTTQVSKESDSPITAASITSSSTTESTISNKCSNSGFMGDTTDCKKFYRCVDNGDGSFIRYEFTCGEGTVWDPKIEACNHAWAVEKCSGSGDNGVTHEPQQTTSQHPIMQDEDQDNGYVTPSYETSDTPQSTVATSSSISTSTTLGETGHCTNSGFMGDKNDCKKFYRCVDNGRGGYDRYEFLCGEGTVWDETNEACNHAWAVKTCEGSASSTINFQNESTTQSSSSSFEDGQTHQPTKKPISTTEAHQESGSSISDQCMQEGFYGNKNDCRKFYRCVDNGKGAFTKYEFTCGEGTSWNEYIQGCDHMSPDKFCGSSTSQIETTQLPTHLNDDMDDNYMSTTKATISTGEIETESSETTKKPQGSIPWVKCISEGFYANPSDCKKFYRCVANIDKGGYTKYDFNCGDGTAWNQEMQACDHESSDKSCSGSSSTQTQTTESQSESTSSSSTTQKQETTDKTDTSESLGSQCKSEGFFAHPNDCKKFIRCVDNGNGGYTLYEFSCGDGTVWVQEIQACDHDNDVNSCTPQVRPTTQVSNTESYPSSSSSSSTVTSSTESMPSNDEYDTQILNEPLDDETDDCTSEGYFANKQDCRKFYRCVDNGKDGYTKYDFACGEGTAWDPDVQTCNYINEVQSCSTQAENGNHQTTTNKNQAESEGTSSTTKATTSTGTSESSSSQDTCESEGYYGDSKDCKKFYRCVDNGKGGYAKYDYTCGEGTIWDQDITTCNHPQDVSNPSCISSQGSSDTSSTTSSTTSSSQATSSTTQGSNSESASDCSQGSSKKPANNNVTCDKAGYYANPNDCKKFYRCVDWDGDGKRFSVFYYECGEGTIWDPALDTCNHEDSVYPQRNCNQTQSQIVGGETTTTDKSTTTTAESTTSEQTAQESTTAQQTTSEKITTEQSIESTTTQENTSTEEITTQESTTSEQTTTQQITTSEQTTTPEPTTSDQTTTQHSATSEQTTTQQSTISEQTTTEQSSTSEQTTTEQSTTSETSTTQQSTTSEQTTTQQSTTSEPTTISEQTTTQQSTTSEQTTTQQSTTTELTTTQQSTTSEPTTISEQTTTLQSTTSEQTTTPQSTTNEQATTQQSTTEQTTTQESTPSYTTTQESTTNEPTTTQQSTTSDPTTTEQSTTSEQTTIQQSTTSEASTTQQSTTSEQTTTQQSTTSEASTTQQSTTSEQTTTQQSTTSEQTTTTEQSSSTTELATDGTTTTDNATDGTTTEDTTGQSTTQTSNTESDSTEDSSSTTEESSSDDKECPETEKDQYLLVCPTSFKRHPRYCNMFYQCIEDDETYEAKVAMFKCPNNTIFDESKTQCVTENKADKKCDGEIANKRRFKRLGSSYKEPIVATKGKQSCSGTGYFSFEKHSECAKGFLKCEISKNGELRGYVYQCPDGYVYWSISKRCERIESVRDCKRSSNDWSGRWNIPVERKNVANS